MKDQLKAKFSEIIDERAQNLCAAFLANPCATIIMLRLREGVPQTPTDKLYIDLTISRTEALLGAKLDLHEYKDGKRRICVSVSVHALDLV